MVSGPTGWTTTTTSIIGYETSGPALPIGTDAKYVVMLAAMPTEPVLRFPITETYGDGHQDAWIEVAADPSVEPEMPAPALTITAATASASAATPTARSTTDATASARNHDNNVGAYAVTGGGAGVVAAGPISPFVGVPAHGSRGK